MDTDQSSSGHQAHYGPGLVSGTGRLMRHPAAHAEIQRRVSDQIAADRHLAGKKALAKAPFGLRIAKIVPPGAV